MSDRFDFGGEIVWRPTQEYVRRSHMKRFMNRHGIESFEELIERSTKDVKWFSDSVLEYLDIQFLQPYSQVLDLSHGFQHPKWCVGGKLNIVHNCLDKWDEREETRNRSALIWEGEDGNSRTITYGELAAEVKCCAHALRALGLQKGDAVGLYMPMVPEIVVALLAIARIGGIILPLFSGFGVGAIISRLNDCNAKCLFTADGFFRRGEIVPLKPCADAALEQVPTIQNVIVLHRVGNDVTMQSGRDHWWHELLADRPDHVAMEPTDAEDPLMVIYTSGTTGKPKGTVHTHCGFPVKSAQDMAFSTDVHPGDLIYWMTDMGWMMGPWLVFGATLLGATLFLYEGAPDYPGPDRVWALVDRHHITQLGISPTFVRALMVHGDEPVKSHDLSSIHLFSSTGEPWNPDPWMWLFNVVGEGRRPIINYSGGTEIGGGILSGNPLLPIKPTAFAGPCPGIAADVLDEKGNSVRNRVGELVIRAPWIGMTRSFWSAEYPFRDDRSYRDTYWARWPDVWVHGDWAAVDDDGFWYILGRSDDTVNVAGKRIGPAEIESVLVNHPTVNEAAVIGVPDPVKGAAIVCFCVLTPGYEPSDELRMELKTKVTVDMGKALQPKQIKFVTDLPKTRNAKVMRRMIRSAHLGEDLGDTSSLVNPAAVDEVRRAV